MIHNLPRFPQEDEYEWASNAGPNGQSILCVSFKSSEMEKIAKQMRFTYPYVYVHNLPPDKLRIAPTFHEVVSREPVTITPSTNAVSLESLGGQRFTHYAMKSSFGQDLYLDLVAQEQRSNLLVETWQRKGPLPSNCSHGYCVRNIRTIRFPDTGVEFPYTKDHSKWAVSDDNKKIICVGDNNREDPHLRRAGGILCSHLPNVWKQYKDSVVQVEPLPVDGLYSKALKIFLGVATIFVGARWYKNRYEGLT
ncbi:Plancitoxin-1 [Holothuria leucospilota]|uniref:Plancitoxin-1 n=1 Tax=Holothuria leucospilota TaxID=206669 RepID=A0A9Q1HB53_HOLLE|nr:Plancitoxin-1 [Holothuria leucospilota]